MTRDWYLSYMDKKSQIPFAFYSFIHIFVTRKYNSIND